MKKDLNWLSISLFCSKNNWNNLLGDGIGPFVTSDKRIEGYTIEFNYLSGENIRLSLRVTEANAPDIAQSADAFFKKYFAVANFPIKDVKLPVDGVFIPFPMNTIQYGLYNISDTSTEIESISICLSKIIITALKDDSIDDETIITFAFYLQVGLIKIVHEYTGNSNGILSMINQIIPANEGDENVIADYALMNEITSDVMQTEEFDSEINWLNDWINLSKDAFKKLSNTSAGNDAIANELYNSRVSIVYKCLGLNGNGRGLISNLVKKSVEQYLISNNTKHIQPTLTDSSI